ncbi:MAG: hypothetical protein KDB88_12885 [Flavobacteriales bacterium]|nr:hypothetical protein [Flavobacteriales bacterium]
MLLAVVNTLRTILVLLIVWWILRFFMRRGQERNGPGGGNAGRRRKRGEVTLEHSGQGDRRSGGNDDIIDAEFEEVR